MAHHPAQQDEERLVRTLFAGRQSGFFVEVGANHPSEGSQTWHLEQAGWTGVLVEPQPDLAALLAARRKAKVFAVACTEPAKAGGPLPLHVDGVRSALDPDRMAPGAQVSSVILVPTRTLNDILREAEARVPIDLVSIDVEGHEIEVLRGFDFKHWRPRLILVEDHVSSLRTHRFLTGRHYRLVRRLGNNGWYVPAEAEVTTTALERWEIVRKYYLALPFRMVRNAVRRMRRLLSDRWTTR